MTPSLSRASKCEKLTDQRCKNQIKKVNEKLGYIHYK